MTQDEISSTLPEASECSGTSEVQELRGEMVALIVGDWKASQGLSMLGGANQKPPWLYCEQTGAANVTQDPICSPSMRMPLRASRWQPHLSCRTLCHRGRWETHSLGRIWMFLLQIVWHPRRSPLPSPSMFIRSIVTSSLQSVSYPNQCRPMCG